MRSATFARRHVGRRAALAVWLLAALPACGQAEPDPQLDDPRLDEDSRAIQAQGGDESPVSPSAQADDAAAPPGLPAAQEALPGLEGTDYLLRAPTIRSEGVFLTLRRGTVLRGRGGEWWFVFHRDADGRAERPMILLPSQALERMAAAAEEEARPVFRVTGQVFFYYGRNYLLPVTAIPAPSFEPVPTGGPPAGGADPSVEALIRELSDRADEPRTLSAAGAAPADAGDLVAEGRLIARRRGRMVREGAAWAFAFDNDADAGARERPMVLVPCMNLEAMEKVAARQGDSAIIELSGRILAFRGRNYIIPTMFQVVRDRELRPMQ